jgi:hypothetical protein
MVEATGLISMESRSSSVSSSLYKISFKSTSLFKKYEGVSLQPLQKFKRLPCWNGWSYEIIKCDVDVTLNDSTYLQNFTKIPPIGSKVISGEAQTDRLVIW